MAEHQSIKPAENGPLLVTGCPRLQSLADGAVHVSDGTVALCRCGGSKNKPFCDGAHAGNGFTSAKVDDRVPDRRESYSAGNVTVHDNRGVCAHAGKCTDGLPSVFRLRQEPFVDPAGAMAAEIAAVVRQCPSGALSVSIDGVEQTGEAEEPCILIVPSGPYAVRGAVELEGTELGEGQPTVPLTLCRCGQSRNKPFCNGAHWNHQFDEHAPSAENG